MRTNAAGPLAAVFQAAGWKHKELDELTALSSAGKLVIAKDSGHEIHLYHPELVVQAIREVVTAARQRAIQR
jgi:hypothetical protein